MYTILAVKVSLDKMNSDVESNGDNPIGVCRASRPQQRKQALVVLRLGEVILGR
jgi:hypothetical protein